MGCGGSVAAAPDREEPSGPADVQSLSGKDKTHQEDEPLSVLATDLQTDTVGDIEDLKEYQGIATSSSASVAERVWAAAKIGRVDIIREATSAKQIDLLTERGEEDESLMHVAIQFGQQKVVEYLLETFQSHDKFAELLLNVVNESHETPLFLACHHNRIPAVNALLSYPACDTRFSNFYGETPLYGACYSGNLGVVEILLQKTREPPVTLPNADGTTPISIADCRGYREVAELLRSYLKDHTPAGRPRVVSIADKDDKNALNSSWLFGAVKQVHLRVTGQPTVHAHH